jgi:5-methyltetrahydropteroyltriglutamate--homocysteine methyltransferase
LLSSDIGSMPSKISNETIWNGARQSTSLLPLLGVGHDDYEVFKNELVYSFIDKLRAGVDVPNYTQFRDMNEMYFTLMTGYEKQGGALFAHGSVKPKHGAKIPETEILKRESSIIRDEANIDKVKVKACVTGPYTLASFFQFKTPSLYKDLGHSIASILRESIFNNSGAELCHVSIDEPVLGFMNDPMLDYGSEGREALRGAWEEIAHVGASHGLDVSMHLHNTSENLVWEVEHLGVLASHVGDPLYTQDSTKKMLEETDKYLWAAIGITQYDTLIEMYYWAQGFSGNLPEKVGEVWTEIRKGSMDPYMFLEDSDVMRKRLEKIIEFFGAERIAYGSPECGVNSFPEYDVALECLRRASGVISDF